MDVVATRTSAPAPGRVSWGILGPKWLRSATLVRAFTVSWAVCCVLGDCSSAGHAATPGHPDPRTVARGRRPEGSQRAATEALDARRIRRGAAGELTCSAPANPRQTGPLSPSVSTASLRWARSRLPAGITAERTTYGGIRRKIPSEATELQPKVAPVATAGVQSTPSEQHPMVIGRRRGTTKGRSPVKGNGFLFGGTPRGNGAAKRCAGLASSSVGEIRGEPMTQAGAPFALGSKPRHVAVRCPGRSIARPRPQGDRVAVRPARCPFSGGPGRSGTPEGGLEVGHRSHKSAIHQELREPTRVLFSLRLPVSPVQLRADARRPHLRAGHRGRG